MLALGRTEECDYFTKKTSARNAKNEKNDYVNSMVFVYNILNEKLCISSTLLIIMYFVGAQKDFKKFNLIFLVIVFICKIMSKINF